MKIRLLEIVQVENEYLVRFSSAMVSGTAQLLPASDSDPNLQPGKELTVQLLPTRASEFAVLTSVNEHQASMRETARPGDYEVVGVVEAVEFPELYKIRVRDEHLTVERTDAGAVAQQGDWVRSKVQNLRLKETD